MRTALWGFLMFALMATTPALAQDAPPIGMWELVETSEAGEIRSVLTFDEDGRAVLEITAAGDLEALFAEFVDEEEDLGFEFGEGTFLTVVAGTWEVDGDVLTLIGEITEIAINDMTAEEFFTAMVDELVEVLAEEQGLSEAEAQAVKTLVMLQMPTLIEDFEADIAGKETGIFKFSVEGDTLMLTDEDGDSEAWPKVFSLSTVETITWGQIKTMAR